MGWTELLLGALLLGVLTSAIVAIGWLVLFQRNRREARALRLRWPSAEECPPHRYEDLPDRGTWARDALEDPLPVAEASWTLEEQPEPWRRRMATLGQRFRDHGVADVTLVHGTFVGTDPLALLQAVDRLPGIDLGLQARVAPILRGATDRLLADHSNFPTPYAPLLQAATGVPSAVFYWSSENGHVARLRAAVRLARHLAARLESRPKRARMLLVGHSHAGQVFALLLHLRDGVRHAPQLIAIARRVGEDGAQLMADLAVLRSRGLDLVTLGTPVRYGWPDRERGRLLHLVNHRGEEPLAGGLQGILSTQAGDYIQQLGIAGSDLPSADPELRALEAELDEPLGPGWAPRAWLENLKHRRRVPDGGFTWLVDYGDAAENGRPNLHLTGLGHAIYTRRATMAYWAEKAAERFYA
ncbi:MAG: hypothetical protein AAGH15_17760 [Myxococcota bacterium]